MNLSVMLFPFHAGFRDGDLMVSKSLQTMRGHGVTGIEPNLPLVNETPQVWADLRSAADDLGMAYSCFDLGANLVGESDADRQAALDTVAGGVEICREVGCEIALVHGSRPAGGMSDEEARTIYADQLAKAAAAAGGSGVTLTIEDYGVSPEFTCRSDHVLEVVRGTDRDDVKITYDNGNFLLADEDPMDAYEAVIEDTVHVHLKDWERALTEAGGRLESAGGVQYNGCHIGEGVAKVGEVTRRLKSDGYEGWISLEVGASPPLEGAIVGADYVRSVWEKA